MTGEVTKCEFNEASLEKAVENGAVGVKRVLQDERDICERKLKRGGLGMRVLMINTVLVDEITDAYLRESCGMPPL